MALRSMAELAMAVLRAVEMNKITWAEIGHVTEPGQYRYRFGFVVITGKDIAIWQRYPNAAFTVIEPSVYAEQRIFKLGAVDLRDAAARDDDY